MQPVGHALSGTCSQRQRFAGSGAAMQHTLTAAQQFEFVAVALAVSRSNCLHVHGS